MSKQTEGNLTARPEAVIEPSAEQAKKQADIERIAMAAQKAKRKMAADLIATDWHSCPRKGQIKRLRDAGTISDEEHTCYFPEADLKDKAHIGYKPVVDPATGEWARHGGDVLTTIPNAIIEPVFARQREISTVRRNERSEEARKDRGVTEEVSTETIAGQVVEPKKKDG